MHDYGVVEALIEQLRGGPEDIVAVRIRAGVAFSPEAMHQAWEMLTQETALDGVRLTIEQPSDVHTCAACGERWVVHPEDVLGHMVFCPSCGAVCPLGDGANVEIVEIETRPIYFLT